MDRCAVWHRWRGVDRQRHRAGRRLATGHVRRRERHLPGTVGTDARASAGVHGDVYRRRIPALGLCAGLLDRLTALGDLQHAGGRRAHRANQYRCNQPGNVSRLRLSGLAAPLHDRLVRHTRRLLGGRRGRRDAQPRRRRPDASARCERLQRVWRQRRDRLDPSRAIRGVGRVPVAGIRRQYDRRLAEYSVEG